MALEGTLDARISRCRQKNDDEDDVLVLVVVLVLVLYFKRCQFCGKKNPQAFWGTGYWLLAPRLLSAVFAVSRKSLSEMLFACNDYCSYA
jgi:hypothetical protein